VAWLAAYLALAIAWATVPAILWRVARLQHTELRLGFSLRWLLLMYKVYNNEDFELPVIGGLAAKRA
jgi:uncharacterized membrane protein